ncbi:nucleotide-binding universal stress UspA family protein [Kibdelosporangium banguiense]|uniref:Nucleotide-binding universal stress UspA family protein n=1 Tax=Kibdelosporangium banguiense TaxID=1365924 RepID=A0ABS4TXP4_9PSEU|nr:universal stress protein [Kibdelosporangium banguiense]MBP2328764.1 nucleotide-binding universal stress UspA family protein [Kibdelosporangium banguiense]
MSTLSEHHRPVVVGIDGSAAAVQAVRWAAKEAAARKLPLRLVHVHPDPAVRYADDKIADAMRPALETQAKKWLNEAAGVAPEAVSELEPQVELRAGAVVQTLVDMSADAAMIVLGARGLGGFTGMLVGTTANSVVAGAMCPVVVVRTAPLGPSRTGGPIVVGVDGSPASEAAIKFAFEEASLRGCALIALHTWTEIFIDPELNVDRIAFDTTVLEQRERELLSQRLAGWPEKYPDVQVTRVVKQDRPVRALLDYDEEAQLLVVGSRGLGGYHGMLLGSTSQALMHYTQTPLVVVRPEDTP